MLEAQSLNINLLIYCFLFKLFPELCQNLKDKSQQSYNNLGEDETTF